MRLKETPPGLSACWGWEKVFWGCFLIIGDAVALILGPGKQTADKDIRGMQRHDGHHCCGQMDNSIGFVHTLASSVWIVFPWSRGKKRMWVDSYVLSRCHLYVCMRALHHHLHVDITPRSVLYCDCCLSPGGRATEQVPLPPGHHKLGSLRGKLSFVFISCSYTIL